MKVVGAKRLARKLRRLPDEVEADVAKMVKKSGNELATIARQLVPVATGDLKSTIKVTIEDRGMAARVTAGSDEKRSIIQARTVEGGRDPASVSGGMAAQPFLNPAATYLSKRIKGRLKRAVNKAAKRVANG